MISFCVLDDCFKASPGEIYATNGREEGDQRVGGRERKMGEDGERGIQVKHLWILSNIDLCEQ